jgi:hypothetical protein
MNAYMTKKWKSGKCPTNGCKEEEESQGIASSTLQLMVVRCE